MHRLVTGILCLVLAVASWAQDSPNNARGFNSETAYQSGDVDSVNVFNGNLIVSIPIGPTYAVGGNLSYGLTLTYNGQMWSYQRRESKSQAVPGSLANVALGWQLSLGGLVAPDWKSHPGVLSDNAWSFVSSDGAKHTFHDKLHPTDAATADTRVLGYTRDGTYMRLVHDGFMNLAPPGALIEEWVARVTVELPNGVEWRFRGIQQFAADAIPAGPPRTDRYVLDSIADTFGNEVRVRYLRDPGNQVPYLGGSDETTSYVSSAGSPDAANLIQIEEWPAGAAAARRKQRIYLKNEPWFHTNDAPQNVDQAYVVRGVELAAAHGKIARYTFTAPLTRIAEPYESRDDEVDDHTVHVKLLKTITLPETEGSYGFEYHELQQTVTERSQIAGHMKTLTLPTGARIEYLVKRRYFPPTILDGVPPSWLPTEMRDYQAPDDHAVAVTKRTVHDGIGPPAEWNYRICYSYDTPNTSRANIFQQLAVAVDNPAGERSIHYFSLDQAAGDDPAYLGSAPTYALPLTFATATKWTGPGDGYYLSREIAETGSCSGTPNGHCEFVSCDARVAQRTYVKYETDPLPQDWDVVGPVGDVNARMAGSISVTRVRSAAGVWSDVLCNGTPCYTGQEETDFDGLGHYETTTRSTNITGPVPANTVPRKTFTDYFGSKPQTAAEPWLLNLYSEVETTEGNESATSRYCFDTATGFLDRRITVRDAASAELAVFTEEDGNTDSEAYSLVESTTAAPFGCTSTLPTPDYQIEHEWSNGGRSKSWYSTRPELFTYRADIDASTGLVTRSYDATGRVTSFQYDVMGRLRTIKPPGSLTAPAAGEEGVAWSEYEYDTTAVPLTVVSRQYPAGGRTPLTEARFYYDGLGRLRQERRRMPSGWSTVTRTYDLAGRRSSISVPKFETSPAYGPSSASATSFTYDVLGRTLKVTEPDGSSVITAYNGSLSTTRTVQVAMSSASLDETDVTTTEHHDGYGRLAGITEMIPGDNQTVYAYDSGDRLKSVAMGAQTRTFVYGQSGLLDAETHPESGTLRFTYDARGHLRKRFRGEATTPELTYDYDSLERLTKVWSGSNLLKEWIYDTNGTTTELGRVVEQKRYNRFGSVVETVTDSFAYATTTGRLNTKATKLAGGEAVTFDSTFHYTDLGALSKLTYPACTSCNGVTDNLDRNIALAYDDGLLTGIAGVTAPIETQENDQTVPEGAGLAYTASGAVRFVQHAKAGGGAGVLDSYRPDLGNDMPRIGSIAFLGATDCGLIVEGPRHQTIESGTAAAITMTVIPGARVQWYAGVQGIRSQPLELDVATSADGGVVTLVTPALHQTAQYWAEVTLPNASCDARTPTITVSICDPVSLPAPDPVPAFTLPSGSGLHELVADATGSALQYRWFLTTAPANVLGTERSYFFNPATAGTYEISVEVTGACGSATASIATITVVDNSTCVADFEQKLDPKVVAISPNLSYALSATLKTVPNATYSFQWYEDGHEMKKEFGVTSRTSTYTLFIAGSDKVLSLEAWVTCNGVRSNSVTTRTYGTVSERCTPPTVAVKPPSAIYAQGQSTVTLTADVAQPGVTYQWYRNESGNTATPISGAALATLTVPATPAAYWVRVTNGCGLTADSPTVGVGSQECPPVRFAYEPQDREVAAGTPVTLLADALPALRYEWRQSPSSVVNDSRNRQSITVAPIKTTDYWVVVGNTCGGMEYSTTSRRARIHVTSCADINISAQPQDQSVLAGTPIQLTINATAAAPLRYQWFHGESGDAREENLIAGATSATLPIAAPENGKYWVRISFDDSRKCAVDSRTVTVVVCDDPVVGEPAQPVSQTGGVAHDLYIPAEGLRLSFAWFEGNVGDESKRLPSTSRFQRVHPLATTNYWVKVSSDCGGNPARTVSKQITVSVCPKVLAQPAASNTLVMPGTQVTLTMDAPTATTIEWFSRPIGSSGAGTLFRTGTPATVSTINTPVNANTEYWARVHSGSCHADTQSVEVKVCSPFILAWSPGIATDVRANLSQTLSITGIPAGTPHTNAWYIGNTGDTSRPVSSQENYTIFPSETTSYWARVTLASGCYSDTPTLTIRVCQPTITTQPAASTMLDNVTPNVTLKVVADAKPHTYQWYIGTPGNTGSPISNATSDSYLASPADDTTYWVRVTGECGQPVNSTAAVVKRCKAPEITQLTASREVDRDAVVELSVTATGTENTYAWYRGAAGDTSNPLNKTTPTINVAQNVTTFYWVKVTGRCGTKNSTTIMLSVKPTITQQPVGRLQVTQGSSWTMSIAATGTQITYQWFAVADGVTTAITAPSTTDTSCTAGPIHSSVGYFCRVRSGAAYVDSAMANFSLLQAKTTTWGGPSVAGMKHTISIVNPDPAETYEWFVGLTGNTSTPLGSGTTKDVYPHDGTDYWTRTTRDGQTANSAAMHVRICTPAITLQPQGGSVTQGQPHRMSIAAIGPQTLTYQWYRGAANDTANPIPGATNSWYEEAPAATTNYWVRVTAASRMSCGVSTASSNTATISVCIPPSISQHPQAQNVNIDTPVTLTVAASGDGLHYEWYEGPAGTMTTRVGTDSNQYTFSAQSTKTYWVRVVGACGTANSTAAVVSVYPRFATHPASKSVCPSAPTSFTATAAGADSYQWRRRQGTGAWESVASVQSPNNITFTTFPAYVQAIALSGNAVSYSNEATITANPVPSVTIKRTYPYTGWQKLAAIVVQDDYGFTYKWYQGPVGNTTNLISQSDYILIQPQPPVTYWVQVTNLTWGCSSTASFTY